MAFDPVTSLFRKYKRVVKHMLILFKNTWLYPLKKHDLILIETNSPLYAPKQFCLRLIIHYVYVVADKNSILELHPNYFFNASMNEINDRI